MFNRSFPAWSSSPPLPTRGPTCSSPLSSCMHKIVSSCYCMALYHDKLSRSEPFVVEDMCWLVVWELQALKCGPWLWTCHVAWQLALWHCPFKISLHGGGAELMSDVQPKSQEPKKGYSAWPRWHISMSGLRLASRFRICFFFFVICSPLVAHACYTTRWLRAFC